MPKCPKFWRQEEAWVQCSIQWIKRGRARWHSGKGKTMKTVPRPAVTRGWGEEGWVGGIQSILKAVKSPCVKLWQRSMLSYIWIYIWIYNTKSKPSAVDFGWERCVDVGPSVIIRMYTPVWDVRCEGGYAWVRAGNLWTLHSIFLWT